MSQLKDDLVRLLYTHQDGALANLNTGNDECRCGNQGDQFWRPHFVDALLERYEVKPKPIIVRSHPFKPGARGDESGCWHQDEPDDRGRGVRCGIYRQFHLT